jgi:hypothetical protein
MHAGMLRAYAWPLVISRIESEALLRHSSPRSILESGLRRFVDVASNDLGRLLPNTNRD